MRSVKVAEESICSQGQMHLSERECQLFIRLLLGNEMVEGGMKLVFSPSTRTQGI
jgi:hypothetical protein